MKVTFPYMGNIYIPLRQIFLDLGIEPIIPPPYNRATLNLGTKYAPELMCIPFKLTLGNLIQGLRMGADTIVHTGGWWSCRFGYYPILSNLILKDLGFNFRHIILRREKIGELFKILKEVHRNSTEVTKRFLRAVARGYYKAKVLEKLERLAFRIRPKEREKGETSRILKSYLNRLDQTIEIKEIAALKREAEKKLFSIPKKERRVFRVKIVGESFCVIEPFINFHLLERLGEMGLEVDPFLTAYRWLGFHSIRLGKGEAKMVWKMAEDWWCYNVGGEDKNTVGYTLKAIKEGYDGIIHLHPLSCMPHTTITPVLDRISQDYKVPILQISLDEFTQEGAFYNRIEAFVELIKRKKAFSAPPSLKV
jgi:predicted nucleotide-binding protein (sugar kinase/HSP70/actin superfamily)